jgi:hypothetical protein
VREVHGAPSGDVPERRHKDRDVTAERRLEVDLICDHSYDVGFPMFFAVEVRNVSRGWTYLTFEPFNMFSIPGPVSFTLKNAQGKEWTSPVSSRSREDPSRESFGPGQAWRSLYDLTEIHPDIPAGHYEIVARFSLNGDFASSAPARIEVHPTAPKDLSAVQHLRSTNDAHESSWRAFLTDNWSTPDTAGLSEKGRSHLAYYLYLHRAAYGPRALAALDPKEPERFGHGPLEAEAAVLRFEILHAAKRPEATGIKAAILERWPGVAWRISRHRRGPRSHDRPAHRSGSRAIGATEGQARTLSLIDHASSTSRAGPRPALPGRSRSRRGTGQGDSHRGGPRRRGLPSRARAPRRRRR